jgi:hypothetical protein
MPTIPNCVVTFSSPREDWAATKCRCRGNKRAAYLRFLPLGQGSTPSSSRSRWESSFHCFRSGAGADSSSSSNHSSVSVWSHCPKCSASSKSAPSRAHSSNHESGSASSAPDGFSPARTRALQESVGKGEPGLIHPFASRSRAERALYRTLPPSETTKALSSREKVAKREPVEIKRRVELVCKAADRCDRHLRAVDPGLEQLIWQQQLGRENVAGDLAQRSARIAPAWSRVVGGYLKDDVGYLVADAEPLAPCVMGAIHADAVLAPAVAEGPGVLILLQCLFEHLAADLRRRASPPAAVIETITAGGWQFRRDRRSLFARGAAKRRRRNEATSRTG